MVIVGAGAAGLCAALRAAEAGVPVVVIERDRSPAGSTALSAGLIPAAGTRFQRAKGIADGAQLFAEDILNKSHGEADPALVHVVSEGASSTVEWLADRYSFPFEVLENFNYPGHSALRMHGLPSRSGAELIDRLRTAAEQADIPILANSIVTTLFAEADGRIAGIGCRRGDTDELIGCAALILACNGFGGNRRLVEPGRRHSLGPAAWRRYSLSIGLSGTRLGRDPAQFAHHLGLHQRRRLSGQPRRMQVRQRGARLFRACSRSHAAA